MKKAILVLVVVALFGFSTVPATWAGPAETGREWIEWAMQESPGIFAEMNPEVVAFYYIDLMSNALDAYGGWQSFLVITNWDLSTRIRVVTSFVPTGGTPSDIVTTEHYINPNDIVYLTSRDLGFNTFGQPTNWYGIAIADTLDWWSLGVLLYHSEYGLTYIRGDGPYF